MLNKNILLKTYKLLFFFKVYPFLLPNNKTEFIKYLIENYINPLASPSAGAPAFKNGDVNTVTPSPGEVKGLMNLL